MVHCRSPFYIIHGFLVQETWQRQRRVGRGIGFLQIHVDHSRYAPLPLCDHPKNKEEQRKYLSMRLKEDSIVYVLMITDVLLPTTEDSGINEWC